MKIDVTTELKEIEETSFDDPGQKADYKMHRAVRCCIDAILQISNEFLETRAEHDLIEIELASKLLQHRAANAQMAVMHERLEASGRIRP